MTEMAHYYEKRIKENTAEVNTSNTTIIFRDKSQLSFQVTMGTEFKTTGAPGSDAKGFVRDMMSFRTFNVGYEFSFKDGSSLAVNIDGPLEIT